MAQTTDSGSNNGTMTSKFDCLIFQKTRVDLRLSNNHIKCFCHKIALILSAGFKAIELGAEEVETCKESTLGFVPHLQPIIEESQQSKTLAEQENCFNSNDKAPIHSVCSQQGEDDSNDESSLNNESQKISILTKVRG